MSKMILMTGIPGSGKSTWLQKNVEGKVPNSTIISRDKIRFSYLHDFDSYFSCEKQVWKTFIDEIVTSLNYFDNVFVDATHLNTKSRQKVINAVGARAKFDELEIIYVKAPLAVALEQNNLRSGRALVPTDTICDMAKSFEEPTFTDNCGWDTIYIINGDKKQVYKRY